MCLVETIENHIAFISINPNLFLKDTIKWKYVRITTNRGDVLILRTILSISIMLQEAQQKVTTIEEQH